MILNSCEAFHANNGFWSMTDTGQSPPTYFQLLNCTARDCNNGILLDDGGVTLVGSCLVDVDIILANTVGIQVSAGFSGNPISLNNNVINNTGIGAAILGGTAVALSGGAISSAGQDALQVQMPSGSRVAITGLTITDTASAAIRIKGQHAGTATITGVVQSNLRVVAGHYGLVVDPNATGLYLVTNCAFNGNPAGQNVVDNSGTVNSQRKFSNNIPYNPVGFLASNTPPAIQPSVSYQNTYGVDALVYIHGGSVSKIQVQSQAGGTITDTGLATASQYVPSSVSVPAGGTITVTYSLPPTLIWIGN
jgi:hypothetical protein